MKRRAQSVPGESWTWLPYFVLCVGILLTAAITFAAAENKKLRSRQQFEIAAQQVETHIRERMEAYVALLRGGAGLFAVNKWVSANEFRAYVDRLRIEQSYPGVQGVGFAYRVTSQTTNELFALLGAQGITDFRIWPQLGQREALAIIYLEPRDIRNRAALGFDMFSEPIRREAMERARDTGEPSLSSKVTLVQEIVGPRQPGFLIYVPIYSSGGIPSTLVERRRTLEGFLYSPFRSYDLLDPIVKQQHGFPLEVEVYDGRAIGQERLLYTSNMDRHKQKATLQQANVVEVAGAYWTLRFFGTPPSGAASRNFFALIPISGVILSLVLFYFTHAESTARRQLARTAAQLTQSQSELTEQREWLRTTLTSIGDAVIATNTSGNIEFMNRAAEELTGWTQTEAAGKPLDDVFNIVNESTRCRVESPVPKVLEQGRTIALVSHTMLIGKNGRERAIEDTAAPIRDASGKAIGVVLVFHDATAQREAEHLRVRKAIHMALRADITEILSTPRISERQILQLCAEALVKHINAAFARIWTLNPQENVLELQASAGLYTHIDGGHARVPVGKLKIGRIAEEKKPHLTNDLLRDSWLSDPQWAKEQGMNAFAGYPLLVEGEMIGVLAMFSKMRMPEDTLDALAPLCDAIAAGIRRKRTEEVLRDREERLRLALESVKGYAIFTLDIEGKIATWNTGAERIFGHSENEVVGRGREMLFTLEDVQRGELEKELHTAIERRQAFHERWHIRKNGERFWASDYIVALRDTGEQLRGFAKIIRDMTEEKQAQEQIEALNRDLERRVRERTAALQESNEQMETFTYTVAHDLRAPLRAMQGFSQALLDDYAPKLDELGKDFLQRIVGASKRMDALIQDLLAYSQLTRLDLTFERASLESAVENACQILSHEIEQRNAIVTAEEPMPDVLAHQATLDTLVFNLVNNAIKFVDHGVQPRVRVWAEKRKTEDRMMQGRQFVRLCIHDNGIGIAPQHRDRIFRVFERLHGTGDYSGTGIGLALVKKGVDRMGGRVGLESEPGKGSLFWIELPAA